MDPAKLYAAMANVDRSRSCLGWHPTLLEEQTLGIDGYRCPWCQFIPIDECQRRNLGVSEIEPGHPALQHR